MVEKGLLRLYKKKGSVTIELGKLGRGSLIGEMSLVDGQPRSATVQALEDCVLTVISGDVFDKILNKAPPWFTAIIKTLCRRLREADIRLKLSRSSLDAANTANLLILIEKKNSSELKTDLIDLKFVKKELIDILGISHIQIDLILKDLENKGIVEIANNKIIILDPRKLTFYSKYLHTAASPKSKPLPSFSPAGISLMSLLVKCAQKTNKRNERDETVIYLKELEGDLQNIKILESNESCLDELLKNNMIKKDGNKENVRIIFKSGLLEEAVFYEDFKKTP
ncbi:MAG: Crp/Fnr family transcriptional regulator [bacterium]